MDAHRRENFSRTHQPLCPIDLLRVHITYDTTRRISTHIELNLHCHDIWFSIPPFIYSHDCAEHMALKRTISKTILMGDTVSSSGPKKMGIHVMKKRTVHEGEEEDRSILSCSLPRKTHPSYYGGEEGEPATPPHYFFDSSEDDGTWSTSSTCSSSSSSSSISFHRLLPGLSSPSMNSTGLCQLVLEYIEEMQTFFGSLVHVTFGEMSERLKSKCLLSRRYLQWFITHKLCVSMPAMAQSFMQVISTFICDEDLEDVAIAEVVAFLRTTIANAHTEGAWVMVDVLANLCMFFKELLVRFKHFVMNLWLYSDRIQRPCEFGKQSESTFLCMECHQEHR